MYRARNPMQFSRACLHVESGRQAGNEEASGVY